ncbi:cysteine desulfurase family protein [Candidatus Latescibacterota bacterium]
MAVIYMDNASGTDLLDDVYHEMIPFFQNDFGNPSSIHPLGVGPKKALDLARERVAGLIGGDPGDIYFTSCGSESNNLAIKGTALASEKKGKHIVVSAIDHQSVHNATKSLMRLGWEVTTVGVDSTGMVDPSEIADALRDDTVLVSVIHASNEIGTIVPIRNIAAVVKERGIPFHTDAVASSGNIPIDVDDMGVDMLSLSANMFGGPKGAAALYIRKGVRVFSLIDGGIQERGRRAGTENVPAIAGFGKAAEIADRDLDQRTSIILLLREQLIEGLISRIPKLTLNGHREIRLPGNVHVSIEAIEGESILYSLAKKGIMAASGSSCADKALKSSHVLSATGLDPALANASILFSLGFNNTIWEVNHLLDELPPIVKRLRNMSPLWSE